MLLSDRGNADLNAETAVCQKQQIPYTDTPQLTTACMIPSFDLEIFREIKREILDGYIYT
jgi:hypothetical protein